DWLAGLMAEQPAPQQPPTAEPFPSDELPSFATLAEEPGAATPALPEETPDWLAGLMAEQPAPQQPPTAEPFPSDELPSFETPAEEPGAAAPALPEETPDWLADLQATFASDATQPEPSSPPPPQPGDHIAEESLPSAETGDAPDWLASLPPAGPAADQPTSEPDADSADDILEWSPGESEFYSPPNEPEDGSSGAGVFTYDTGEAPAANGTIAPFTGEDLPDWLSLIPTPGNAQATTGETAGAESLSPAEIPTWLEAMRPVTSLTPDETPPSEGEDAIQPSGPLAGLRGILTSATAATQYRTPPAYSAHLQVSERQQKQAGLLEDALTSEKQAVTAAEAARRSSQRWVRVVMGLILIAALLGTLLFTSSGTPPASAGDPSRVLPFHQVISSLAPGSAVLLAVDYNAGYAGEMRFSAGYVVQELIVRQSRLVWVSTLPTGPILAQSLQQTALDELAIRYGQPDLGYLVADKTANLGYLAGGVTSLQEFASQPQQAVRYGLEGALDGTSVWSRPALDGIQRVSDFAAVIVITDDAGTARAWVEQVEPALADTPLLLVVSAQAAPMAIPYLESAQVDAILSGMGDGMAYERLTSVKASGNNFWRAYQVGILVIMLFTLLGVVLQLSLKPNARSKPKRKAG
ncbi:MAG: hypothetical protein HPY76_10465, partial [Anaerolineae bacterium]|nr:hypothetical protein [Anaerolineae bacterium]